MRMTKIVSIVVTLFLFVTTVSGQSILQDYFKGNKDSLVIEANKLINLPEPIFKPSQPTNIDPEVWRRTFKSYKAFIRTKYWLFRTTYRRLMPPLWFLLIPSMVAVYGYANAKIIGQGENLPKGVALQWRDWCINPNYFDDYFKKSIIKN